MRINRINYELYMVDYFEGNLSKELSNELLAFFDLHADLKTEFLAFNELTTLSVVDYTLNKNPLKQKVFQTKNINELTADEFLIAQVEGDLSVTDELELTDFLTNNPFYNEDLALLKKSKLQVNEGIVFPNKEELKKQVVIPLWTKRIAVASIAAALLIGVFIFRPDKFQYHPRTQSLAQVNMADPAASVVLSYQLTEKNIGNAKSSNKKNVSAQRPGKIELFIAKGSNNLEPDEVKNEAPTVTYVAPEAEKIVLPSDKIEHFKTTTDHISPKQAITKFLKTRVVKEPSSIKSHLGDVELAQTVVKSVNKIFGSKISLSPTYNDSGDMVAYAVENGTFGLERSVNKK